MQSLLEKLNINKIISIDDSWNPEKKFLNSSPELHARNNISEYTSEEEDLIYDSSTMGELKEKNNELFFKILKDKLRKDTNLEKLEELFPNKLETFNSIEEFQEASLKDEMTLFIVDIDMGKGKEDSVIQLLRIIEDKKIDFIVLVYSNSPVLDINFRTSETKKKYLEDNKYSFHYLALIHPIKKGTLDLEGEFKKSISKSYLHVKLHKFLENKKELDNEIYKNIYCSELQGFEKNLAITFKEGEGATDLIKKLFLCNHNQISYEHEKFLVARKELITAGDHYYSVNNTSNEKVHEKLPYSIIDFSINKYYKDIYSGDLFAIETPHKKRYGVVVSKSCDMIIRGNEKPKRSLSKGKVALLMFDEVEIKINPISGQITRSEIKAQQKSIKEAMQKGQAIWPIKITGNISIGIEAKKTELEYIDDFILDLCSLDEDGKAKTNYNKEEVLKYKNHFSKKYFQQFDIKEKIDSEAKRDLMELFNSDSINVEENENKIFEILFKSRLKENTDIQYEILDNNEIKFNVTRIGRLSEDKSLLLYQKCLFDLSKRGIDRAL